RRTFVGKIVVVLDRGFMYLLRFMVFVTSHGGKVFGVLLAIIYLAAMGASLGIFSARWRHAGQSMETWRLALLASCVLLPVLLDIGVSHLGKQIFYYRYLLICLPALVVLAARGLCRLESQRVLSAGLAAVFALSMATVWRYYAKPKENWRDATQYVLANSRPGDTLISYPWYAQQPIRYYEALLHPPANVPHLVPAQFYSLDAPSQPRPEIIWLLSCREDAYLRLFRKDLSQAYPFHHQWRYDGAIVLEEYSSQGLARQSTPDLNAVASSSSPLFHWDD